MPIPGTVLGRWSHPRSAKASVQAHESIRVALSNYDRWPQDFVYKRFLQGSFINGTNLQRDSDVDLVVQLRETLSRQAAGLSGSRLRQNQSHINAHRKWQLFREHTLNALRTSYGVDAVTSGRKSLKVAKGPIHANADVVITLRYEGGLAFFLPDEHRWVVSYPQLHYQRGLNKEESTNRRYKRVIRMFKAARNYMSENSMIEEDTAPSYFVECLLYNIPNELFRLHLVQSYEGITDYLSTADLEGFQCQNGKRELFGSSADLWSLNKARRFVRALVRLWDQWDEGA